MSYSEALQIGWSITWRQFLWGIGASAAGAAVQLLLGPLAIHPVLLGLSLGAALLLIVFPRIIQRVTRIEYSGYQLRVQRPDGAAGSLTYFEALPVAIAAKSSRRCAPCSCARCRCFIICQCSCWRFPSSR
jgi:hypothetical protein